MKKKIKSLFQVLLIIFISISYNFYLFGQEKLNISAGIGIPEMTNIGLKYQFEPMQFGFSLGLLPLSNETLFTLSGDIYYHFAGTSALSDRRPWFGRIGLAYLRDETDRYIDKYLYLNARIGRDFNFLEKVGLAIDAGVGFELYNEETDKQPGNSDFSFNLEFPVIPSLGIALFYRI